MTPSTMDWIDEMISIGFTPRKMTHYLNALVDDQRKLIVKLSYFVNSFQVKPKRRVPTLLLSQSCGRQCLIMQPFVDTNLSKEQVDLINGFLTNKDLLKEAVSLYGGDPEVRNIGHINGELVAFDW